MMGQVDVTEDPAGFTIALLDDPGNRNAVDGATVRTLRDVVHQSPGAVLVLGSTDERAFSSGAGLHLGDTERANLSDSLYSLYQAMRASPKILIAAASGHAVGAGAQLMLASDIRVGSPSLSVRFAGAGHGLAVGSWGLPSLIGRGRALDLCLSMRPVAADEALAIGLVDRVVDDPLQYARDYAERLCALEADVVRRLKEITSIADPVRALDLERELNSSWDGVIPD